MAALYEAVEVNSGLYWRPQDVRGARTVVGCLPWRAADR